MAAKILKYAALPAAVVGLGSFRIYSTSENKNEELISSRELSIYSPDDPVVQFVEKSGVLQTGLGSVRVGLQPYIKAVQNGITSVKVGVISAYQAGEDTYHFLRDPPPGFLPRVGVITVSGLGGLILARKGSRLKRTVVPLCLAALGTAVCYPTQTVAVLKITGKRVYRVSSSVASMFQSKPEEASVSAVSVTSTAPGTTSDPVSLIPESKPTSEVTSESAVEPIVAAEATSAHFVVDTVPDSAHEPETDPEAGLAPAAPAEEATPSAPPTEEVKALVPTLAEASIAPTVEEPVSDILPPANHATDEEVPVPVLEATPPSVEAPPPNESPVQQIIVEPATVKSRFVPDPSLLDHGQANPEDADMYSTRS